MSFPSGHNITGTKGANTAKTANTVEAPTADTANTVEAPTANTANPVEAPRADTANTVEAPTANTANPVEADAHRMRPRARRCILPTNTANPTVNPMEKAAAALPTNTDNPTVNPMEEAAVAPPAVFRRDSLRVLMVNGRPVAIEHRSAVIADPDKVECSRTEIANPDKGECSRAEIANPDKGESRKRKRSPSPQTHAPKCPPPRQRSPSPQTRVPGNALPPPQRLFHEIYKGPTNLMNVGRDVLDFAKAYRRLCVLFNFDDKSRTWFRWDSNARRRTLQLTIFHENMTRAEQESIDSGFFLELLELLVEKYCRRTHNLDTPPAPHDPVVTPSPAPLEPVVMPSSQLVHLLPPQLVHLLPPQLVQLLPPQLVPVVTPPPAPLEPVVTPPPPRRPAPLDLRQIHIIYCGTTRMTCPNGQQIALNVKLAALCAAFGINPTNVVTSWSLDAPRHNPIPPATTQSTIRLTIFHKNLSSTERASIESAVFNDRLQSLIRTYCH